MGSPERATRTEVTSTAHPTVVSTRDDIYDCCGTCVAVFNSKPMPQLTLQQGNNAYTVAMSSAEPVLNQAIAQGVPVPNSCRRGDCGLCAVSLSSGHLAANDPARPWRRQDDYLLCNCIPVEGQNATVELPWFPELEGISTKRSPTKINELRMLSADVLEVVLRLPPANRLLFLPGQHVRLTNAQQVTRSYSLAAPPAADGLLRIQVRKVEGGAFSDYLFQKARPNDLLQLEGPFGHFFLRDQNRDRRHIFLATGTGIAPVAAMLQSLAMNAAQRPAAPIELYWGNRTRADAYLHEAMLELRRELDFEYRALCSRELPTPEAPRHVQSLLTEPQEAVIYAVGSPAMVEAARQRCMSMGVDRARFIADPFTAS